MRPIFGVPYQPESSYILILRGIDDESYRYYIEHQKLFPHWGCVVVCEIGQETSWHTESSTGAFLYDTSSHYKTLLDDEVIKIICEKFPPYEDDEDPIVAANPFKAIDEWRKMVSGAEPGALTVDSISEFTHITDIVSVSSVRKVLPIHSKRDEIIGCKKEILHRLMTEDSLWETAEIPSPDGCTNIQVRLKLLKKR